MESTALPSTEMPASDNTKQPGPQKASMVWPIVTIALIRLVLNTARRFIYPFAPALSRDLNVPLPAITTLIAVNQTTGLLGLAAGPLADRWGWRTMMHAGLALLVIGMGVCFIAPRYSVVFVGLLLAVLGKNVFDPAVQAFIGHHVPFERRGLAIGAIETAWAGSTFIGIPVIALIIDEFGLRWSFLVMSLFGAVGYLVLSQTLATDTTANRNNAANIGIISALQPLFNSRPALGMMGFAFWINMANDNLFVIYGAWLERDFGMSLLALGMSTSVIGAAELLGETCTAIWADRIGIRRSIIFGIWIHLLAYVLLPVFGFSLKTALVGLFLLFVSCEFTTVCSFSLSTEIMPANRATMMAGYYAAAAMGRMIGALSGSPLWFLGGISAVTLTSAVGILLAILSFGWGLKHWTR